MRKKIRIGSVTIGPGNPVAVQSMTNTDTKDLSATVGQIKRLEKAGCDLVRVSVYDESCAKNIPAIKKKIKIPLVADIHFDYRLALAAIENGADKIRINPGNIGSSDSVKKIIEKAAEYNVPIRIGVNAGSLKQEYKKAYLKANYPKRAEILNDMLSKEIAVFEKEKFSSLVLSLKTSDVLTTIETYRLAERNFDYPLHLGVTEAGSLLKGSIRSAAAFSVLLSEGIGDTIRVSLASDPVNEVMVAGEILASLGKRTLAYEVIACPTCSRTTIDIIKLTEKIEKFLANYSPLIKSSDPDSRREGEKEGCNFNTRNERLPRAKALAMTSLKVAPTNSMVAAGFSLRNIFQQKFKIAVMGCVVNGPGEAADSDLCITGVRGDCLIFRKGKLLKKVKEKDILNELKKLLPLKKKKEVSRR